LGQSVLVFKFYRRLELQYLLQETDIGIITMLCCHAACYNHRLRGSTALL